jgi:hypothetical protein
MPLGQLRRPTTGFEGLNDLDVLSQLQDASNEYREAQRKLQLLQFEMDERIRRYKESLSAPAGEQAPEKTT